HYIKFIFLKKIVQFSVDIPDKLFTEGRVTMLLNQILSRENMLLALKRVEQNRGSHGVDMMPVQNLRQHMIENWSSIKGQFSREPISRCLSEGSKSRNLMAVLGYWVSQP